MRHLRCFSAALAVGCLIPALAGATEIERVHKVFPLRPDGVVRIHNFSGTIRIVGADVSEVTVDAVRRARRPERLKEIVLDIQSDGNVLTIEANKKIVSHFWDRDNVVDTDFDIQVPRKVQLDVDAFSSDLQVRGVAGRQNLHTFSGEMRVSEAGSPIKAKAFSGDIQIELLPGETRPTLDLDTFSGAVDVRLPAGAEGTLDVSTFSGSLRCDLPMTVTGKTGRHVRGTIGRADASGSPALRVKTFSGDVTFSK